MIEFLVFFFPSFISLGIVYKSNDYKKSTQEFLINYAIYTTVINFVSLLIIYAYRYGEIITLDNSTFTVSFAFKYMMVSMFIAIMLPVLDKTIRKIIDIKIEVKKYNGKKRK